jgi:hypothetical protein
MPHISNTVPIWSSHLVVWTGKTAEEFFSTDIIYVIWGAESENPVIDEIRIWLHHKKGEKP